MAASFEADEKGNKSDDLQEAAYVESHAAVGLAESNPDGVKREATERPHTGNVKSELQEQPTKGDHDVASYYELAASTFWLHKIQCRVPRLYSIVTELILPLLILIGMAFLFGYGLARLEMVGEIERNNQAMAQLFTEFIYHTSDRLSLYENMGQAASQCLGQLNANYSQLEVLQDNYSAWNESMFLCAYQEGEQHYKPHTLIDFVASGDLSMHFNWMNCPDNVDELENPELDVNFSQAVFDRLGFNPDNKHDRQFLAYIIDFDLDLNRAINTSKQYTHKEIFTNPDLLADFTKNATGATNCKVHLAGGALFWFTIMTTIGYGHAAPTTTGGRLMVYTCGFLTIIGFIALNNMAANVWKNLVEDVFHRLKWKRLIHGPLCVLFWLCLTFLWILVIAVAVRSYRRIRINEDFPLSDAYWFSYVTTTTVGFGDYYISYTEFQSWDMFFVPLIVLMAFNFLGIFAEKLVDLYNEWFPARSSLSNILSIRRHGHHKMPHNIIKEQVPTADGNSMLDNNNLQGGRESSTIMVGGSRPREVEEVPTSSPEMGC